MVEAGYALGRLPDIPDRTAFFLTNNMQIVAYALRDMKKQLEMEEIINRWGLEHLITVMPLTDLLTQIPDQAE